MTPPKSLAADVCKTRYPYEDHLLIFRDTPKHPSSKRYRFFDIGTDHYYYDDYENARSITETADNSYVPALNALIEMAERYGSYFKCAISLSGCAIEQLENHAPQVIELLQKLNDTRAAWNFSLNHIPTFLFSGQP